MAKKKNKIDCDFNEFLPPIKPYDFSNKEKSVRDIVSYWLNKSVYMFDYKYLPEDIDVRNMELSFQAWGFGVFPKDKIKYKDTEKHYVLTGGLGGDLSPYYYPTKAIITNPWLDYNSELEDDKTCIIAWNDSAHMGLLPLFTKWATLLVENELTMYVNDILKRIQMTFRANSDSDKASIDLFITDIIEGKIGTTFVSKQVFDDLSPIESLPLPNSNNSQKLTESIELEQYIKASLYNELGLKANYNMKRESLNSAESSMNDNALLPLCLDMLETRRKNMKRLSKLWGLEKEIEVDFSELWKSQEEKVLETTSLESKKDSSIQKVEDDGTLQKD